MSSAKIGKYHPTSKSTQEAIDFALEIRDKSIANVDKLFPASIESKHSQEYPNELPLNTTPLLKERLTHEDYTIVAEKVSVLLEKIANGIYSSVSVAGAYLRAAVIAQHAVNCITELLPEEALATAQKLDNYLRENGKTIGPLHGLPISIKEMCQIKGHYCNFGFVAFTDNFIEEDPVLLKNLYAAGAVPFARTTNPQSLMQIETHSNIYGTTNNPHNANLTCGGSSGGEGALIGFGASPVGVATDIGGSIRTPASNCGVYAIKPSSGRLPGGDFCHADTGAEAILGVVGPVAKDLETVELFMSSVISQEPWRLDPSLSPIPWNSNSLFTKKIKIAILDNDGIVTPHPPVQRAMKEVIAKLEAAKIDGLEIELVRWQPYRHDKAWEIISSLYFEDGAQEQREILKAGGEKELPLTSWIFSQNVPEKPYSIAELWAKAIERDEYRSAYNLLWEETGTEDGHPVDVILTPATPGAAPPHHNSKYWGYTAQWNLLDYPAVIFPVTKVDQNIDKKDASYFPKNPSDQFNYDLYDPEKYVDAPVSLQVVGRRLQEEKVIQACKLIERAMGRY
ncbi:Amd2p [Sugiyamaella lignohabitans]|uniref:amidase n=1 Tax=Sugiyamaella lignohabitans TaxID=796027 RepID=A0A167EGS5_9ASCO|nr:Amd2p [Sugiyamaella lignohabitans]ANB14064.1 Amd2p [Sugiyamaella lignohabitans]